MSDGQLFLNGKVLFMAFEDWADAGKVSTTALRVLLDYYQARPVKRLNGDEYIDYHVYRPQYVRSVREEESRQLIWPSPTIYRMGEVTKVSPGSAKDIFFLLSPEPNMRWHRFANEIVDFALANQIDGFVILGSMLTDVPHTRPFPMYLSSEEPRVRFEAGVSKPNYEGPVSVGAAIQERGLQLGVSSLSLWAPVPHYTHAFACPKALTSMLSQIENLLSTSFPEQKALIEESARWEIRVTKAIEKDPKLVEYVKQLEMAQDGASLASSSNDQLIKSLERYLHSLSKGPGQLPASRIRPDAEGE